MSVQPAIAGPTSYLSAAQEDELLSSALLGAAVFPSSGPAGAPLGVVRDLVIAEDGALRGAVIGVGGVAGMGERRVAVPYAALTRIGETSFMLEATASELEAAPEFNRRERTAQGEALAIFKNAGERAEEFAATLKEGTAQFYAFSEALLTGEEVAGQEVTGEEVTGEEVTGEE
ncbi:MAG: PRC-barrel domain-containing protein [Pseudomonadota bacterium]